MSAEIAPKGGAPAQHDEKGYIRLSTNSLLALLALVASGNLLKSFDLASRGDVDTLKVEMAAIKVDVGKVDDKVDELARGLDNGNTRDIYMEREMAALRAEIENLKRGAGGAK